jgi:hypothetical protein
MLVASAAIYGMGALASYTGQSLLAVVSGTTGNGSRVGQVVSAALLRIGAAGQVAGRVIFLTVTVPPYLIFYQFPRWIITEQLPLLAKITAQYIEKMGEILFRLAQAIGENAFAAARLLQRLALQGFMKLQQLFQPVMNAVRMIWQEALRLSSVLATQLQKVAAVVQQGLYRTIDLLYSLATEALRFCRFSLQWTATAARWMLQQLEPVGRALINAAHWAVDLAVSTVQTTFRLLQPIGRAVVEAATWVSSEVTRAVGILGNAIQEAWQFTARAATAAGQLIVNVATAITQIMQSVANTMVAWITPGLQFVAQRFKMMGLTVVRVAQQVVAIASQIARFTGAAASTVASAITSSVQWIYRTFAPPVITVGRIIGQVAVSLAQHITATANWVYKCIAPTVYTVALSLGTVVVQGVQALTTSIGWASLRAVSIVQQTASVIANAGSRLAGFAVDTVRGARTALVSRAAALSQTIWDFCSWIAGVLRSV